MDKIDDIEFGIILPKYDNSMRKINPELHEKIAKEMSERFGGVTIIPSVLGCWVDERRNKLVCEENAMFLSVRDTESVSGDVRRIIEEDRKFMENLGKKAGKLFGQAAIMELQGKREATFIEGEFRERLPEKMLFTDIFKKML